MNSLYLFAILAFASLVAGMSDQEYKALWDKYKSETELPLDEVDALLKQIAAEDAIKKHELGPKPERDPYDCSVRPDRKEMRIQHVKSLIATSRFSANKCNYEAFKDFDFITQLAKYTNDERYIRQNNIGLAQFCEQSLLESADETIKRLSIENEVTSLKAKLLAPVKRDTGSDENDFGVTPKRLAEYLDPYAKDEDVIKRKAFKKLYKSKVLDICEQVKEIEPLKIIDHWMYQFEHEGTSQPAKDWESFYGYCEALVSDYGLKAHPDYATVNLTHKALLRRRELQMKRSFGEKIANAIPH